MSLRNNFLKILHGRFWWWIEIGLEDWFNELYGLNIIDYYDLDVGVEESYVNDICLENIYV